MHQDCINVHIPSRRFLSRCARKGLIIICIILSYINAAGQNENSTDSLKRGFSIFNPVPKALMREDMETDRPDITESPITVDAGHFQIEGDLLRFKKHSEEGNSNRQLLLTPVTIKAGLTNDIDFQIVFETVRFESHATEQSTKERYSSYGSLAFRLKKNIIGNDGDKFAIAALPYIKLPSNKHFEHHLIEGGVIVPMVWKLSEKWSVGFQEEVDYLAEEEAYDWQLLQSLAADYEINDRLKGILETYMTYEIKQHHLENYVNLAIQLSLLKNVAFDVGTIQGFQPGSEHHYYAGFAVRL